MLMSDRSFYHLIAALQQRRKSITFAPRRQGRLPEKQTARLVERLDFGLAAELSASRVGTGFQTCTRGEEAPFAMLKSFEHVGMTVSNMDQAVAFYCDLLGLTLHLRKKTDDGSDLAFLDAGGGMLEIIAPVNGAKRAVDVPDDTAGLRHLTFLYASVDETFAKLEAAGVDLKERPRFTYNPEVLHKVAFVRDPDGIIIELAERKN